MSPLLTPVVAHSWGWDEILMFAVPIALALAGIRWAERRAARRHDEAPERDTDTQEAG